MREGIFYNFSKFTVTSCKFFPISGIHQTVVQLCSYLYLNIDLFKIM